MWHDVSSGWALAGILILLLLSFSLFNPAPAPNSALQARAAKTVSAVAGAVPGPAEGQPIRPNAGNASSR